MFYVPLSKNEKMDYSLRLKLPIILHYLLENDLLPAIVRNFSVLKMKNFVQKLTPVFIIHIYFLVKGVFGC